MSKVCAVILIISISVPYSSPVNENSIFDDTHCGGKKSGCGFLGYVDNGRWIDKQTGEEISSGECIKYNATVTASCYRDYSYFGHKTYAAQCTSNGLIHSGYCSDEDHSNYTENKDCIVPRRRQDSVQEWRLVDSGQKISLGAYVKENLSVRLICASNYELLYGGTGVANCQSGKLIIEESDDCATSDVDPIFCEKFGCILPDHPTNGKWIDEKTSTDLRPGRCVKKNTYVSVSCNLNFLYFGKNKFHWKCDEDGRWIENGFCSGNSHKQYKEDTDCVVPVALKNSKWTRDDTKETILPGTYTRDKTRIRTICDSNYTFFSGNSDNIVKCSSSQWVFNSGSRCLPADFKGFQENRDCIVPSAINNTKWFLHETENEVLPETYVKENTEIQAICNPNFKLEYGSEDITKCKSGKWTNYKPICLDLPSHNTYCENNFGCVVREHPDHGKWVDRRTGIELTPGTCIQENSLVNASCDNNYNYYGYKKFVVDCIIGQFPKYYYSCSDQSSEGYGPSKDCIVPGYLTRSKWLSVESNEEIPAGVYVQENFKIRSVCFKNFTRNTEGIAVCAEGKWSIIPNDCGEIYVEKSNKSEYDCLIPEHLENGQFVTWDSKTILTPGNYAKQYTILTVVCKRNHKYFSTIATTECNGGKWHNINDLGACEAACPTLKSTEQYKVTCISKNKRSENCTEPLDGAIAEITCQPIYQNLHIWESRSKFRVCLRGKWDNNVFPNCIPKSQCGLKAPNLQPLIVHGTTVSKGGYPWHVAIYKKVQEKRSVICGGSLISDRLIISAAHCVTDGRGTLLNETNYEVAVGKHFNSFNDPRDEYSQSSTLLKMIIPETYKAGTKNFVGDFTILVAKETFNLHEGVLPICLNFGTDKLEEKLLTNNKLLGYLPGFGITETGNVSETLKEIAVPLVKHENCSKYLPEEFIEYYSYDKFCAGYLNESTAACSGDSGGGLVVQNPLDDRFYLIGVVSVSPMDVVGSLACDIQQYTLYTKVADYIDFVREEGADYLQVSIKTNTVTDSPYIKECQKYVRDTPDTSLYSSYLNLVGNRFDPGDLPFLASIGTESDTDDDDIYDDHDDWFCTGSLISDRFVLAAASCASLRNATIIVTIDIYNKDNYKRQFKVEEIFTYPDYTPPQVYNDIALFKLDQKVEFSDAVYPACLDRETDLVSKQVIVEGLSLMVMGLPNLGDIELQTQAPEECSSLFRRISGDTLPEGFVDTIQFCVKLSVEGLDAENRNFCHIFPGTPFPIVKEDPKLGKKYYSIAGVTSNFQECPRVNNFMLFTKLDAFVPWIESIVWPSSEPEKNSFI